MWLTMDLPNIGIRVILNVEGTAFLGVIPVTSGRVSGYAESSATIIHPLCDFLVRWLGI